VTQTSHTSNGTESSSLNITSDLSSVNYDLSTLDIGAIRLRVNPDFTQSDFFRLFRHTSPTLANDRSGAFVCQRLNETERPSYHSLTSGQNQLFGNAGVYNGPFDSGLPILNLSQPHAFTFRQEVHERLKSAGAQVILPFVDEIVAGRNVEYALGVCGLENCVAVSARSHKGAERSVTDVIVGTDAKLVRQQAILECFNWEEICRESGISLTECGDNRIPHGTKGLTVLAGIAFLAANGRLSDNRMVIFSDTDFVKPEEYDSISYLGIPLVNPSYEMIMTAKTGSGRNNELITSQLNLIAQSDLYSQPIRDICHRLSTIIWPLTGARMINSSTLVNIPWPTSMGIEMAMNIFMASKEYTEENIRIAQVCNPNELKEDGTSNPVREFAVLGACASFTQTLLGFLSKYDLMFHHMDLKAIKMYNQDHGGRSVPLYVQASYHAPQQAVTNDSGYILPPFDLLLRKGWVDVERIKNIYN
jgi:hypothetical protein